MHGVFRLIQNEVSKIFHHLSWKIITIILMILSAVIPIFTYSTISVHFSDTVSEMEEMAAECEDGSVEKEYYLSIGEACKFYESKGLDQLSWQYGVFMSELTDCYRGVKALELYLSGNYDNGRIFDFFHISSVWTECDESGESYKIYCYPDNYDTVIGEDYEMDTPLELTKEIAQKMLENMEQRLKKAKENLDSSYKDYIMGFAEEYRTRYEQAKTNYALAEAAYKKDSSKLAEYDGAKLAAEGYKIIFDALDRTNFDAAYSDVKTDNLTSTLTQAFNAIEKSSEYALYSEKEFEKNMGTHSGEAYITDYQQYRKIIETMQEKYYQVVKICAYGTEHNLNTASYYDSRKKLMSILSVNLSLICFTAIFMAGSIVANEHTSGAIRLLLIRPRARWKILLSKLCCVAFYFILWTAATSLVTFIVTIAFYGPSELFSNYMVVSGGTVKEVAPLFYMISELFLYTLPGISMVLLSFMLSVIFKRAGTAMILPLLINIFGGQACHLFWGIALKKLPVLRFTPIPYFNLISFTNDPFTHIFGYDSPLSYGLTLNMGLLMFLIYSALIIATAFIVFKKQQVKS